MHPDPDWNLVDRYLSGECAPDEAKVMNDWLASDPSHERLLASMRRVWSEAANPAPAVDEDAGWRALRERIVAPAAPAADRVRPARPVVVPAFTMHRARRAPWRAGALAAAAALVIGAGATGLWRAAARAPRNNAEPPREYVTARGQRAEVTLIDGTRVWLSVDSRLRVPQSYGATSRDVELDGEAYFVVQHDARRPFRVHAGGGVSEDLGTEFDVRAYPGDSDAIVIVASGRVALGPAGTGGARRGAHRDAELGRGQMGRLDRSGGVEVTSGVDLDASLAWRRGRLGFDERPFADVQRELERWYDIDIDVDDSTLASVPITASFTNQSADEALAILAGALGAQYTRTGRHVRISTASGSH